MTERYTTIKKNKRGLCESFGKIARINCWVKKVSQSRGKKKKSMALVREKLYMMEKTIFKKFRNNPIITCSCLWGWDSRVITLTRHFYII